MPVLGPARWPRTITTGTSFIPESESPSVIRQNPPPDVPTAVFFPAYPSPSAISITAISFSG